MQLCNIMVAAILDNRYHPTPHPYLVLLCFRVLLGSRNYDVGCVQVTLVGARWRYTLTHQRLCVCVGGGVCLICGICVSRVWCVCVPHL